MPFSGPVRYNYRERLPSHFVEVIENIEKVDEARHEAGGANVEAEVKDGDRKEVSEAEKENENDEKEERENGEKGKEGSEKGEKDGEDENNSEEKIGYGESFDFLNI